MAKNTSITLGNHFESFVRERIEEGRYGNASEVIRSGLRLLEEHEAKVTALQRALIEGEESGEDSPLDIEEIIASARQKAGRAD